MAEEYELYLAERFSKDRSFEEGALYAGKNALIYDSVQEEGNIYTVLKNSSKKYVDNFEVIKGELYYFAQNEQEKKWAQDIGIKVSPYIIIDGELMSADRNLNLMDEATGSIIIPQSVTKIGEGAFSNLEGLRTIVIPGTVKEIGNNAFSNNKTLEKVIIQDGVETIGDSAFKNCANLKSVDMPDTVTRIGATAFYYCVKLQEINISNNVKTLYPQVFDGCILLKEITLPENLEIIHEGALACGNLTYLKIPASVTYIHQNFCLGRNNINEIDLTGNKDYKFENGFLLTMDNTTICYISPNNIKSSSTFAIPEGVITYGYTTNGYTNIKKLILPSSLKEISGWRCLPSSIEEVEVDQGNTYLVADDENKILYNRDNRLMLCYSKDTNIKIKDGIIGVKGEALEAATNAKEIIFPDSVFEFEYRSFSRINTGVNIVLGKNVNQISEEIMDNNDLYKIGNVTMSEENQRYAIRNNVLYSKDNKTIERVLYGITGEFVVEPNIEKISIRAFYGEDKMTNVILSSNLKEIEGYAFSNCQSLTKIDIPSTVNSIGSKCFELCTNLAEVKINKKENSITGAPWENPYGLRAIFWKN